MTRSTGRPRGRPRKDGLPAGSVGVRSRVTMREAARASGGGGDDSLAGDETRDGDASIDDEGAHAASGSGTHTGMLAFGDNGSARPNSARLGSEGAANAAAESSTTGAAAAPTTTTSTAASSAAPATAGATRAPLASTPVAAARVANAAARAEASANRNANSNGEVVKRMFQTRPSFASAVPAPTCNCAVTRRVVTDRLDQVELNLATGIQQIIDDLRK